MIWYIFLLNNFAIQSTFNLFIMKIEMVGSQQFNSRTNLMVKSIIIFFLVIILFALTNAISGLVYERSQNKNKIGNEIASSWGQEQTITGPIIAIPYHKMDQKGINSINGFLYLMPDQLNISGQMDPEIRSRGIYQALLYKSSLNFKSTFNIKSKIKSKVSSEILDYNKATVIIGISDLTGIRNPIMLHCNESQISLVSGTSGSDALSSGVSGYLPSLDQKDSIDIHFSIDLNGYQSLSCIPVGKNTMINLQSSWSSPSFFGQFLPQKREISDKGFNADWQVLEQNRIFNSAFYDSESKIASNGIGVRLIEPVDSYLKNERNIKYALLIICLCFMCYFFIEIFFKIRIHPIQYFLIGASLTIFYLLILSMSEHIGFNLSYFISSAVTIFIIVYYSHSFLKRIRIALIISGILSLLFGYIFIILQLEDYALIAGSIGLFVILAIIMMVTRKINYYDYEAEKIANETKEI